MGDTYYRIIATDVCTWLDPPNDPPDGLDFWPGDAWLGSYEGKANNGVVMFRGVAVPKGAEIETCVLKLGGYSYGDADCKVRITFNDVDSASLPESPAEAKGMARTAAYVDWTLPPLEGDETEYSSPELKTILQEVVNREGWSPAGCSVAVLLDDNGSGAGAEMAVFDERLYVKYATGGVISTSDSFRALAPDCGTWHEIEDEYDDRFDVEFVGFGESHYGGDPRNGLMVFRDVAIPAGARITTCRLKVHGHFGLDDGEIRGAYHGLFCRVRITFNDVDSAELPEGPEEARDLARTTAYTDWNVPPIEIDCQTSSPELKAVLQEIVDREGWESGNNIGVLIHDNGSDVAAERLTGDGRRHWNDEIGDYEYETEYASVLYVEYEHEWLRPFDETLSVSSSMDGLIDDMSSILSIDSQIDGLIDGATEHVIATNHMGAGLLCRETVEDFLETVDVTAPAWTHIIPETIELVDPVIASLRMRAASTDGFFSYDRIDVGWGLATGSTLTLADAATNLLGLIISEWLTLIDAQHNNWNGREIVIQPLNLYDIISYGKVITDTIDEPINITDSTLIRLTVAVLDYMGFSSLSSAMKSTAVALDEPLTLEDSAWRSFPAFAESILTCVDTATLLAAFIGTASSELSLGDSSSLTKMTRALASSPMVFTDSIANTGAFYNVLYDTLAMNVLIELDDEIYECYVLSTPKFLPSMYSGFDFNSYCVFENRAYGANRTGIYELTGETDAGTAIHTGVVLHDTDFGTHNFKRFRKGYMGISGQSPVMILETEDGTRRVYTISDTGRTTASHEQKSKKWKISIAEFDNLDTIQLVPIILTR